MSHAWQPPFDPQASQGDDNKKALAVHIALMPFGSGGSLVYFSGNRWDTGNHRAGNVDHTAFFDYTSRSINLPGSPQGSGGLDPNHFYDLFCSGHALLADGRLLVAGGTSAMAVDSVNPHNGHWGGLREAFVFDPNATPAWQRVADMNTCPLAGFQGQGGGRWYPSLVTLPDGSVLAICGHPRIFSTAFDEADPATYPSTEDDPRHDNNSPDRYLPCVNSWAQLSPTGLGEGFQHDFAVFYPRVHVLPSGKLLIVQPLYNNVGSIDPTLTWALKSLVYDPDSQTVIAGFPGPQNIEGDYLNPGYAAQPTTAVLLPLLPQNDYQASVLVCGGVQAAKATITTGSEGASLWTATSARQAFFSQDGVMVIPPRAHSVATLLPTGEVFVSGGMNQFKDPTTLPAGTTYDQAFGVLAPEIYNPATNVWTALTDAPATVPRGYHSVALLMPDGRVLTTGSEKNNIFGAPSSEFRMEIFEPDYIAAPQRLTITHSQPSVNYGDTFQVQYQLSPGTPFPTIARVALIRYGSVTHAFNYDQRYVGLNFEVIGQGQLQVVAPPNAAIAPPGYYMLWLLDNGGRPCVQSGVLRIGSQRMYAEMDRSVFSIYDVQANQIPILNTTIYNRAFYVVFDGFVAREVDGLSVNVSFSQPGLSASLSSAWPIPNPALENPGAPQLIQRTIFAFDLTFDGTHAFDGLSGVDSIRNVDLQITAGDYQCSAKIELVMEPSPFMLDGDPSWLSEDIRVFQVTPQNASMYLPGFTWTNPNDYIAQLLTSLNQNVANGQNLFAAISADEQQSALSLLPTTDGTATGVPIFNFAVARVRLDSKAQQARFVRVLFRLFRTQRPSLVYNTATIYRRSVSAINESGAEVTEDAIPLLGVEDPDIISIPFFASPRQTSAQDMTQQQDAPNLLTLPPGNNETVRFFGCWLDINQPATKQFPRNPGSATNFASVPASNLLSIQELITGFHQCLVTEVHYKYDPASPDLPLPGDSPSSTDKLSQRNLCFTNSSNPGSPSTRTVQHTIELKIPASPRGTGVGVSSHASVGSYARYVPQGVDALVLWWNTIPDDTVAEIYLPGIDVSEIIRQIPTSYTQTLIAINDHTLQCAVLGDCTVIPLPPATYNRTLSGLLTLRLPEGVKHGQVYQMAGQQFSVTQQISGGFELRVLVEKDESKLLIADKDALAILKHSLSVTPVSDRWYPVILRMTADLGLRVGALGGDPNTVLPSPYGAGPHPPIVICGPHGYHPGKPNGGTGLIPSKPCPTEPCFGENAVRFIGEMIVPRGTEVEVQIDARIKLSVKENS